jgi:hypothetical protein
VLARLVGNVADCDNTAPKFRSVKTSNAKFEQAVWDVPGAAQVLFLAGWRHQGERVELPEGAPLGPVRAAASRLRRLAERRGHSGAAESVAPEGEPSAGRGGRSALLLFIASPPAGRSVAPHRSSRHHPSHAALCRRAGSGGRPPSSHYGKPGFRYQGRIYHCSCCDHPINDGSERLFTGRHDAPHGEYRYECTTCTGPGAPEAPPFNLCPGCWDRFQGGEALHERSHAFQHVGPRMTRHNDYYGNQGGGEASGSGTNPWGAAQLRGGLRTRSAAHEAALWNPRSGMRAQVPYQSRLQERNTGSHTALHFGD